jgi:pimeloyl-ACP methyl ester carboxylesterase
LKRSLRAFDNPVYLSTYEHQTKFRQEKIMAKKFLMRGLGYKVILFAAVVALAVPCSAKTPCGKIACVKSSDGELISYNVFGSGNVTLVFVHGWSCDSRYWREQIPHFAKKYQVVTVDLAGHGHSEQTRKVYSLESFGQDVNAVVRQLDAKKVILIGHSMSGSIIAEAAKLMPDRVIGLIGVDTLNNVEDTMSKEDITRTVNGFKKDFKSEVNTFVGQMLTKDIDPELKKWIIDDMSSEPSYVAISAFNEYMEYANNKTMANIFKEIKVPLRCVNSDFWPTNPEINRRYMLSFDVSIMKGTGHFLMLERPGEFNKLLDYNIKEILKQK